ncbi:MAG: peptidyl-prolyl cis-trans isomerase [Chloroflexota bacterium]
MAATQGQRGKSVEVRRLALLGFAALLVLLFVIFAVAQGIGHPSVPSGDVAVVEDVPDGTVSKGELEHAIEIAAAQGQIKPVPKPGDEKYDELKEAALGELFDTIWIQGQAAEMGFTVTSKEVEQELDKLKKQAFKTEKQYEEFLEESHYTEKDVDRRVKVRVLSKKIQEQLKEEAPVPSKREIENYYEAAKATQFTTPESRDIRIVVNKDKGKVEEAKAQLEKDHSAKSWEKVAKKFSTDPATKGKGGLQSGVSEAQLPEPLSAAVFETKQGDLGGPLKESRGWVVFEVSTITPAKTSSLEEVKSQISSQLEQQASQSAFTRFLRNYNATWRSRTFCADGFKVKRCANYPGEAHPAEADPACYEANPKKAPEACPAPVIQTKPAKSGSVTVLAPEGQKLAQRPRPAGEEPTLPEGAQLPPGVVPGG